MRLCYISIALLLLIACKKGPYTCYCRELQPVNGTQQYDMGNKDYDGATVACEDYEKQLNANTQNYDCFLD